MTSTLEGITRQDPPYDHIDKRPGYFRRDRSGTPNLVRVLDVALHEDDHYLVFQVCLHEARKADAQYMVEQLYREAHATYVHTQREKAIQATCDGEWEQALQHYKNTHITIFRNDGTVLARGMERSTDPYTPEQTWQGHQDAVHQEPVTLCAA
jgi:hypothetical protein